MASLGEHLTQALSVDPIALQADARRLRGEEMREMADALKRWIGAALAGPAPRDRRRPAHVSPARRAGNVRALLSAPAGPSSRRRGDGDREFPMLCPSTAARRPRPQGFKPVR